MDRSAGPSRAKISFGGLKKPVAPSGQGLRAIGASSKASKPNVGVFDDEEERDQDDLDGSARSRQVISGAAPSSRASRQRQEQALSVDASVFDYDGVYDSMKGGEREAERKREEERRRRDPKYIDASLVASEQRKLDRQRAEAKKIQRERDEEGEEFAETEAFVTESYKKQMADIRRAEEEDAVKEKRDRTKAGGMATFYKDILQEQERAHRAAVVAAAAAPSSSASDAVHPPPSSLSIDGESEEQRRRARIHEARRKGLNVQLNDDNEVVDERNLLNAGLNTLSKRKRDEAGAASEREKNANRIENGRHQHGGRQDAQRRDQSRLMEAQILAMQGEDE